MDTAEKSGGTFNWIASYFGLSEDLVSETTVYKHLD